MYGRWTLGAVFFWGGFGGFFGRVVAQFAAVRHLTASSQMFKLMVNFGYCCSGVCWLLLWEAALIGSYCSSTAQLVSLGGLPGTLTAGASHTEPYYENLVSGTYNSSYRLYQLASATAPATLKHPRKHPRTPSQARQLRKILFVHCSRISHAFLGALPPHIRHGTRSIQWPC